LAADEVVYAIPQPTGVIACAAVEGVVAGAAPHRVIAFKAVQLVGADAADQDVAQSVARANEVAGADVGQVLNVSAEGIGRCDGLNLVVALASALDDGVVRLIDDIDVVADAAG